MQPIRQKFEDEKKDRLVLFLMDVLISKDFPIP